ncbi:MAG: cytochrome c maturation protein CcmE [Thermoanaerobaculia bacterium]|jgi:cytochrome c-type biogenesis protein CcmE|nr:MAG: cytochrome c maturation protein CcmE [Thermoanaerobaculia bacterium]MBZ0101614.1 cytochrome c maturation protein CcmE [Thermoanaerobaculia bacterium]
MSRRAWTVVGIVLLVAFAGFAFASFRTSLTPYVSYAEAQRAPRTVQVAGALEQGSTSYDEVATTLHFVLRDPETGVTMPVEYDGVKPANFEDAISIVAIGRWDAGQSRFAAGKLLVKCPSKYQGAEVKEYS